MRADARPWTLHPRLEQDTVAVGDMPLSRVLLMNDATYPWLILAPRRPDLVELFDLAPQDRRRASAEVDLAARALKAQTRCDKLNIAAIGNVVPQLHIHVVARRPGDPAWPKPVWGFGPAQHYTERALTEFIAALRQRLGLPS